MNHVIEHFLHFVTNLGDSGLLSVLALLGALYLYGVGGKRTALAIMATLFLCLAIMGFLKVVFIGCGHLIPWLNVRSPSGHAAMSAAIYGTFALIVIHHFENWKRYASIVGAAFLVFSIAASRILLGYHTVSEVGVGLLIGLLLCFLSYFIMHGTPRLAFKLRFLGLIELFVVILLYGAHAPAEDFITKMTAWLQSIFSFCT